LPHGKSCHHIPLVFVDGACSGNGSGGASSGIGGLFGETPDCQWSIPIDDSVDTVPVRTNQRAELLAAIEGVYRLGDYWLPRKESRPNGHLDQIVVATDSEYVYKGITEWMPKWKVCRQPLVGRTCILIHTPKGKWMAQQFGKNRYE
jgi:ribonuclease HI